MKFKYIYTLICIILVLVAVTSCNQESDQSRLIDLKGEWRFALDSAGSGIHQQWYLKNLNDTIELPGTTDTNQKGYLNSDTTTSHLHRVYHYEGAAWYSKNVSIPDYFRDQHILLYFERTKPAMVWIDSTLAGRSLIMQSPQIYDVTDLLDPGEHTITVMVNNSKELTPYGGSHIYSDDTQTNWNGIIGEMYLEAVPKTHIANLQVFPDVDNRKIDILIDINDLSGIGNVSIELLVEVTNEGQTRRLPAKTINSPTGSDIELEYVLGDDTLLWDEYTQPLYRLTAVISGGGKRHSKTVPFGMRKFAVDGTQFTINGRTTFLRGKHEGGVFPLTGYTPTDVESWRRVFEIARSYGINHYRFHSYTPPEAAFTAADQTGIYIQAELPFWGGLDSDSVAIMLREEGMAMLRTYGNHPSFVMLSHGNELWDGHERAVENIAALKAYDRRPLYTEGSNNNIGYRMPPGVSDYFVGTRTPSDGDTTLTHTRLTHAFVDSRDGGILNTTYPSTMTNFSYPVSQLDLPIVSHEIGQYQIYPDFSEIDKYTGILRARNLEVFRERLKNAGMSGQAGMFQKASGAWAAICYKAEMEAALRTEGMGGFRLLDLQDFPGQGTALVGILDAFMDSKDVISREDWLQSINDVVLLAEFPRFVWTTGEIFKARIKVANYSSRELNRPLNWVIDTSDGEVLGEGEFSGTITYGGLSSVGDIQVDLSSSGDARKLALHLSMPGTGYTNSYSFWVYPPSDTVPVSGDILVTEVMDTETRNRLGQGGRVLWFPASEDVEEMSVPGLFPPDFWNYEMFKTISMNVGRPYSPGTLGLLMDPGHPVFNSFPTDFHTNQQWFSIIKASRSFILDDISDEFRPIVQVIDNLQRNHKMGLIFEFRVGEGMLLVCMSRLPEILDRPEAVQLYRSIIAYMGSTEFRPDYRLSIEELSELFILE